MYRQQLIDAINALPNLETSVKVRATLSLSLRPEPHLYGSYPSSGILDHTMIWDRTEEGDKFWRRIYQKLEETENPEPTRDGAYPEGVLS